MPRQNTPANSDISDEQVWDALTRTYGGGWDDETDLRQRVVEVEPVEDMYADAPRVERIRKHTSPRPHMPGEHWQNSSCLCGCHYGHPAYCDDAECKRWRVQNARRAEREQERKRARWQRKHGGEQYA